MVTPVSPTQVEQVTLAVRKKFEMHAQVKVEVTQTKLDLHVQEFPLVVFVAPGMDEQLLQMFSESKTNPDLQIQVAVELLQTKLREESQTQALDREESLITPTKSLQVTHAAGVYLLR